MNSIAVIRWKKRKATRQIREKTGKQRKKKGGEKQEKRKKTTNNKITKIGWRSLFWRGVTILIRGLAIFILVFFFLRCEHYTYTYIEIHTMYIYIRW